jgi:two-component system, NarL family, response regulator DegU
VDTHERTAVVADTHPMWLDVVQQLLEKVGISVVARTTSVAEAPSLVNHHQPDVLVTELSPGEDRLAPIRDSVAVRQPLKTIVLSASEDPRDISDSFAAGAAVYCVKTADQQDVAAAIRQAFASSVYFASGKQPHRESAASNRTAAADLGLTRRETEILGLVANGHSNAQLAKMLWVTEQTVKFHLSNIYRKLNVANRTEAARWAHRHGLVDGDREYAAA